MNGPALVAFGCRTVFLMRCLRALAQAHVVLAKPSALDRWLAALPPEFVRANAAADARAIPGLDTPAVRSWLGDTLDVDFDTHPARAFGVTVARIVPSIGEDERRRFDWAPPAKDAAERTGRRAIIVPTPSDIIAVDPDRPDLAWSLSGDLDPLGWDEPALDDVLAGAMAERGPVVGVCEDALSWLAHLTMDRAGGIRAVLRHGPGAGDLAPAIAVLDWRAPFVDRLLRREDVTLIAESDGHAEQLEHAIDAWRKRQVPRHRPEILVADAPAEAVLAGAGPA